MGSVFSKRNNRMSKTHFSVSSQERIFEDPRRHELSALPQGIQVTREVEVAYQPSDAPFVHAALVGLVMGEILNPRLART